MMMRSVAWTTILVGALLSVVGCVDEQERAAETTTTLSRRIQVCVDYSGSYEFAPEAFSMLAAMLPDVVRPGDLLFFRWVNESSYSDAAAMRFSDGTVASAELPGVDADPAEPDAFDPQSEWSAYRDAVTRVAAQRQWFEGVVGVMVDQLDAVDLPAPAQATDVNGCVEKFCDLASGAGDVLWIFSDMEDNVGRPIKCQLPDVQVIVSLFQCDTPCPEKRWHWASVLAEHGAGGTYYLDPSLPATTLVQEFKEVTQ
jgi:hypothetical protein